MRRVAVATLLVNVVVGCDVRQPPDSSPTNQHTFTFPAEISAMQSAEMGPASTESGGRHEDWSQWRGAGRDAARSQGSRQKRFGLFIRDHRGDQLGGEPSR